MPVYVQKEFERVVEGHSTCCEIGRHRAQILLSDSFMRRPLFDAASLWRQLLEYPGVDAMGCGVVPIENFDDPS